MDFFNLWKAECFSQLQIVRWQIFSLITKAVFKTLKLKFKATTKKIKKQKAVVEAHKVTKNYE